MVLGTGHAALFALHTVPRTTHHLQTVGNDLISRWPENLVLSYDAGALRTSGYEGSPVNLPFPSQWSTVEGLPQWFVVLDTRPETTSPRTDSLLTVTQENLWIQSTNQSAQALPWSDIFAERTFQVTRTDAEDALPQFVQQTRAALQLFTIPAWFVFSFGRLAGRALELLIFAWAAQTLLWLVNLKVKYWVAYRLGALLLIPAETCILVWQVLYPESFFVGSFWWVWMAFLALIAGMLRFYRPTHTA